MLETLFYSLLINVGLNYLQGRRTKVNHAEVQETRIPTTSEDSPHVYGVGVFRTFGTLIWMGDIGARRITQKVKKSLFSSTNQTTGYEYYAGMWLSLCGQTAEQILSVKYREKPVWSGFHALGTGESTLTIRAKKQNEQSNLVEGCAGTLTFYNTPRDYSDAPAVSYIEAQTGAEAPRYAGTLHAVWKGASAPKVERGYNLDGRKTSAINGGFLGSDPTLGAFEITVRRYPDISDAIVDSMTLSYPVEGSLSYAPVKAAFDDWHMTVRDIDGDANPALTLLELITSRAPGLSQPINPWCIDVESFFRGAQRFKDERLGISASWGETQQLGQILDSIYSLGHCIVREEPRTSRLQLVLLRETDEVQRSFDSSSIVRIHSLERVAPEQLVNRVELSYDDREFSWTSRVAQSRNAAGVKTAGAVITDSISIIGVTRASLASRIVSRELRSRAAGAAVVSFDAFMRAGEVLGMGDVIELYHEPLDQRLRLRVKAIRYGALSAGTRTVSIEAVEDVFRSGLDSVSVTPLPADPVDALVEYKYRASGMMLAPYALSGQEADLPMYWACVTPTGGQRDYRVAVQEDELVWSDDAAVTYSDSGTHPAVSVVTAGAMEAERMQCAAYLDRGSDGALTAHTKPKSGMLALLGGEEFVWIKEWQHLDSAVTLILSARGIYDTTPKAWPAGTPIVLLYDYVIYPEPLRTDVVGPQGQERLLLRAESPSGIQADTEQAFVYKTYQTPGRAVLPLPPAKIVYAGSMLATEASRAAGAFPRSASITVGWKYRNKQLRAATSYYSDEDQKCGLRVAARVGWLLDNGNWADNDEKYSEFDSSTVTVSTTNVPAGVRLGRLRVWSETAAGVRSRERVVYFKYAA